MPCGTRRSRASARDSSGCARGNPRWHARSSRDSVSFSPRPPPGASGCKSRISRTPSGPRHGTPPRRPWRCCCHHDGRHATGSHGRESRRRLAGYSRRLRAGDRSPDRVPARAPARGASGRRTVRRRGPPMFKRVKIGEDAAHWMAVLGMDQYAHALAARLPEAALVDGDGAIAAALQAGRLPVLAPYHWLRAADPLPHSWEVTSDTIAAWLAGQLGARRVVLIKPAHALDSKAIVDSYFLRTLPHGVEHLIITADDLGQLDVALREGPPPDRDSKGGRRAG